MAYGSPTPSARGRTTLDPLALLGLLCAVTKKHRTGHLRRSKFRSAIRSSTRTASRLSICCRADGFVSASAPARPNTTSTRAGRLRHAVQGAAGHARGDAAHLERRGGLRSRDLRLAGHRGRPAGDARRLAQPRWINLAAQPARAGSPRASTVNGRTSRSGLACIARPAAHARSSPISSLISGRTPALADRPAADHLLGRRRRAQPRDRLKRLADMGIDDALVVCPFDDPMQLEAIRALF